MQMLLDTYCKLLLSGSLDYLLTKLHSSEELYTLEISNTSLKRSKIKVNILRMQL
ncbi:hypothetical protein IFVP203_C1180009 [Vibrio parahaemolyticus]